VRHSLKTCALFRSTAPFNAEQYWQTRLEAGRGSLIPSECTVLSVFEDWPGGAGNALGTMYAWHKACAQAAATPGGADLVARLAAKEVSCAIFHTAGKGTRLAPLPGSENNNKPGVKLPVSTVTGEPYSILESVIVQTGIYAASRKGRLSVFWGDQVSPLVVCPPSPLIVTAARETAPPRHLENPVSSHPLL
jgi:hypothetical protein